MAPQEHNNMFARLFPTSPAAPAPTLHQKFIKVRIVTWNMAEQRPKGDLSELFDFLPIDHPPHPDPLPDSKSLPPFSPDASHPYHLVVVGGQECPSSSNIPKALGAGFKLIDKEKDITNDKSKPDKDSRMPTPVDSNHDHVSGWTQMLEDWLCNGGGILPPSQTSPSSSVPDLTSQGSKSHAKSSKGMYQLLVKERLMGIYLAIFVHIDVKRLIRGTSKDAVATGLIGGRLGNKGGVGISLNISGTTMLFLNCHLAAHEGKVHHRLANFAKIKAELSVDDFLPPDDHRAQSSDITGKFDFTFLFGDLNFRLDISRLHADWLIARQEYQKALAFDQLSNIMRNGIAFLGFTEAPIDFAPTFKYDVLKTIRHSKSKKQHNVTSGGPESETDILNGETASLRSSVFSRVDRAHEEEWDEENDSVSLTTPILNGNGVDNANTKWLGLLGSSRRNAHRTTMSLLPDVHEIRRAPTSPSAPDISESCLRPPPLLLSSSASQKSSFESYTDVDEDKAVYDSSAKQRVPSWCDRILTKSTVLPSEGEPQNSNQRGKSRVGNFFSAALRFPGRSTRHSFTSPAKSPVPDPLGLGVRSAPPIPDVPDNVAPFSRFLLTNPVQSEPESDGIKPAEATRSFAPSSEGHSLRRSVSTSSHSTKPNPIRTSVSPDVGSSSKWRFLSNVFLHSHTLPMSQDTTPKPVPQPQTGDVVCLSYSTLSNRSMRNLEARSDHRPLVGSYAAYI